MPLQLGAALARRVVEAEPERKVTVESLQSEMLLSALNRLHDALALMPAPVVHVDQPDLSDIVTAVTQLNGPATPEEIARAIKAELAGGEQPAVEPVLAKLVEALDRLDFRLKGIGSMSGGGGGVGSYVQNSQGTSLDTQLAQLDTRYEWQIQGSSSVPLYVGTAQPGTATTTSAWRIDKYTYGAGPAGDHVPMTVQSANGAWDSRASLFT
jgi:hypothetical protein